VATTLSRAISISSSPRAAQVRALVVRELMVEAEVAGGAVQVGGDDVPADAALGEVVQGSELPREAVRLLVPGDSSSG